MFFGKKKTKRPAPPSQEQLGKAILRNLEDIAEHGITKADLASVNAYLDQIDKGMSLAHAHDRVLLIYKDWPVLCFRRGEVVPYSAPIKGGVRGDSAKTQAELDLKAAEQRIAEAQEALALFPDDQVIAPKAQAALAAQTQMAEKLRARLTELNQVSEEELAAKAREWAARLRFQYGYDEERRQTYYKSAWQA